MSQQSAAVVPVLLSVLLAAASGAAQEHAPRRAHRPSAHLTGEEAATVALHARVLSSVVTVLTVGSELDGSARRGLGTGVLMSAENHVLTAAHVVDGADSINVKTPDGKLRPAAIQFSEPEADVALLKLETPDPELPFAELGDSDQVAAGQRLLILGSPRGLENSLSVGHVSAFREFGRLYDGAVLLEFIQTDAAINSGNSGGPAFDSAGRVVGIASRIMTHSGGSEGLGFVVAINTAKGLLALEHRAWTGMQGVFLSAEQLANLLNVDRPGGLLLQTVAKGSPAERAGLRGGSIIAQVGGERIVLGGDLVLRIGAQDACHAECLAEARTKQREVSRIPVTYMRGGKILQATIELGAAARPDPAAGRGTGR